MDIRQILQEVKNHNAPDVHIMVGQPPVVRLPNGDVYISPDVPALTLQDVQSIAEQVTPLEKMLIFKDQMEVDFSFTLGNMIGESGKNDKADSASKTQNTIDAARFPLNLYT